ncbi:MAG TPA: aminoglycoside phosphotransferase family protein [Ktedonobacteraceae bacterium]|nr:aminoglycoside phosphotransferase family protein [Ktedonobacteraceae bacterium]
MKPTPARSPKEAIDLTFARYLVEAAGFSPGGLELLAGGMTSRAYGFESSGERFVLRVNAHRGYERDRLARELLAGRVPVPELLAAGNLDGKFWAVSRRVPGVMVGLLPSREQADLVPQLVETLRAIHQIDVSATSGFGPLQEDDTGSYPTWARYLAGSTQMENHLNVPRAMERATTSMRTVLSQLVTEALPLFPAQSRRQLLHRDYNLANVLVHAGRVTGVVDWQGMGYGDPMYDAAETDFWVPELGFASAYALAAGETAWQPRVRCYQLLLNARALAFFINTGQEPLMGDLSDKARKLLDTKSPEYFLGARS